MNDKPDEAVRSLTIEYRNFLNFGFLIGQGFEPTNVLPLTTFPKGVVYPDTPIGPDEQPAEVQPLLKRVRF